MKYTILFLTAVLGMGLINQPVNAKCSSGSCGRTRNIQQARSVSSCKKQSCTNNVCTTRSCR